MKSSYLREIERRVVNSVEDGEREVQRPHFAKFYREDGDLLGTLVEFTTVGFERDQAVVVIATPPHRRQLHEALQARGVSVEEYVDRGQLMFVDAEPIRQRLTADGMPDNEAFDEAIGDRTREVIEEWSGQVRVFGELSAPMVNHGEFEELKCLEQLWTENFGDCVQTMCGYRFAHCGDPPQQEKFRAICQRHHKVLAAGEVVDQQEIAELQRKRFELASAVEHHQENEAQLEETLEHHRRRDHRRNEFLAMLAHELRNPLAAMRSAVHLLQLQNDGDLRREHEIIERQLDHMGHLVDQLVDVSRISRGTIDVQMGRIELDDAVERAIEIAKPSIDERSHRLHLEMPDSQVELTGDVDRLIQAVSNLLTNAAKYTPDGGDIHLEVSRSDGTAEIRVRDNGRGIHPEELPRVFDLFYRAGEDDRPDDGGLGVGLALVEQVVEHHDGSVEVYSRGPGEGSEFVVRLPCQPAGANSHRRDQTTTDGDSGREVLLVDDNRDFTDTYALILENHGHRVRVAYDGESALEILEEFNPEVVFIDRNMPGMSGDELGRRLAERRTSPSQMRLVAVTGYDKETVLRGSEPFMFDEYLVKPVEPEEFQALLEAQQAAG